MRQVAAARTSFPAVRRFGGADITICESDIFLLQKALRSADFQGVFLTVAGTTV